MSLSTGMSPMTGTADLSVCFGLFKHSTLNGLASVINDVYPIYNWASMMWYPRQLGGSSNTELHIVATPKPIHGKGCYYYSLLVLLWLPATAYFARCTRITEVNDLGITCSSTRSRLYAS